MIEISKNQAKDIRKVCPNAPIAKTRHKYYLEESSLGMAALQMIQDDDDADGMVGAVEEDV